MTTNNNNNNNLFGSVNANQGNLFETNQSNPFEQVTTGGQSLDPFANTNLFAAASSNDPFASNGSVSDPFASQPVNAAPEKTEESKNASETKKEDAKDKKDKKQSTKKEAPKKTKPTTPPTSLKVDTTWNIAYAGQQVNPPEDNMSLEQVRQWLELSFPELSKERTKMDVQEEQKLVVPIVSGAKKG